MVNNVPPDVVCPSKNFKLLENNNVWDANTTEEEKNKYTSQKKNQDYILYDDFLEENNLFDFEQNVELNIMQVISSL